MRSSPLLLCALLACGTTTLLSPRVAISTIGRGAAALPAPAASPPYYTGWAMTAYPEMTQASMDAAVTRQKAAGANLVWIGHNNPGEVGARKREPALSYAVYAAYRDAHDPLHADAVAMVTAEFRLLEACRKAQIKAVLPIGYQIQMGKAWNTAHPHDVRRDAAGQPLSPFGGGVSASFYAPSYRRDIRAYYTWVNATFVAPYSSTLAMINLADEPSGGDYSSWSADRFRALYHHDLLGAGADLIRQKEVGAFESTYITRYASWSAAQWLSINPTISTTMSFDGGQSRYAYQAPLVESLFRDPPANFAVTFDAYPRDGLFDTPLRDGDLISLGIFIRALGAYSSRYSRPFYLWSAANSWGLNGASVDPGNIADAVANGIALAAWATSTGGDLRGIAAWSYNVKAQGLYNDSHHTPYAPDAMFHAVSASFATLQSIMAGPRGHAATLILAPDGLPFTLIGSHTAARGLDPYHWTDLAALTRNDVASAVVSAVAPADTPGVHRIVVLPAQPAALTRRDLSTLRAFLHAGGTVIAAPAVAALLAPPTSPQRAAIHSGTTTVRLLAVGSGSMISAGCAGSVELCFSDSTGQTAPTLWEMLLGGPVTHDGYVITGGGRALLYTIASPSSTIHASVSPTSTWTDGRLFATDGTLRASLPDATANARTTITLRHREYALFTVTTS